MSLLILTKTYIMRRSNLLKKVHYTFARLLVSTHTNVNIVDIRRKRQILTCIWGNIKKGIIEIANPITETRYNVYLPVR